MDIDKGDDCFDIYNDKEYFHFDEKNIRILPVCEKTSETDIGGKMSVFSQKEWRVAFKLTSYRRTWLRTRGPYKPPRYLIGRLVDSVFTKYFSITYTRKHIKQAKEMALKLMEEIYPMYEIRDRVVTPQGNGEVKKIEHLDNCECFGILLDKWPSDFCKTVFKDGLLYYSPRELKYEMPHNIKPNGSTERKLWTVKVPTR